MSTRFPEASFSLPAAAVTVPPLASGDRLKRAEFERRYSAMGDAHAELVEGVVFMASPLRADQHGAPHFDLSTWLGQYRMHTPGVVGADNATLRVDDENELQPDCVLRIEQRFGGQSDTDSDGYLVGAPELVAEISASSVSIDLHGKLHVYRRLGVREYLVWRVLDAAIDWFVLKSGEYHRLAPAADGLLHSQVFPGLKLDAAALLQGNMPAVAARLSEGLRCAEHASFVRELADRAGSAGE